MPTGTKIAAIVLVVLLGAAGLYYAFVPPAPAPKFDPSRGSTSGATAGAGVTDPLSRPSTLPPAGASFNTTGAGAGIDALAGRTGTTVPGANSSNATMPGSTAPTGAVAGTSTTTADSTAAANPAANPAASPAAKYGFQNGRGSATPPGPMASESNVNNGTAGTAGSASTNIGAVGNGATNSATTGTAATNTGSTGNSTLSSTGSDSTYVVKKGDTFETISKSFYGSTSKWKEIAKANPTVDPTRMKIGAKLRIPAAGASVSTENAIAAATRNPTSSAGSSSGAKSSVAGTTSSGTHVIAKGDTYSSLARAYYGDSKFWKAIAKANPKISEKSLSVGTKVAIPPKSAVVSGSNIDR